ncbi:MAG: 5'/3'-nucleotidase SurE, partial [Spirochaetae bacterium HGW-Spirochaetae-8]
MVILLTNDDGYQAEGIEVLEKILLQAGHEV